jgi:plastocyanin
MRSTTAGMTLFLVAAVAAGCASNNPFAPATRSDMATTTRTGQIHDVRIGETVTPKELQVKQGDEIRWINMRTGAVRVVFLDTLRDRVSCANKFGGSSKMFASPAQREFETKIDSNEVASLCLSKPGTYTYTTRMESTSPGGEKVETAMVRVEGAGSTAGTTTGTTAETTTAPESARDTR